MRKLLVLLLFVPLLPVAASAQPAECDGNFHLVHTVGEGQLNHVDLSSPNDGWAVGSDYETEESSKERPFVVHFDRNSFERITPPTSGKVAMSLQGVEAFSPEDVHAVGHTYARAPKPVSFHWDGAAWNRLETPTPGVRSYVHALSGSVPNDLWAVGAWVRRSGEEETLVLHYDGTEWRKVAAPSPGTRYTRLLDVDMASASEGWAVGYKGERPLLLEWTGEKWRRILPDIFRRHETLHAVDAVAPDDVWVAGGGHKRTLIAHYDGTSWVVTPFPDERGSETFFGIAATATDAWAVGQRFVQNPYETVIPLAGRFGDGAWGEVGHDGDAYGAFEGVTVDDTGAAWAVGETFDPEGPDLGEVIERAC